jgi:hypothetical protein
MLGRDRVSYRGEGSGQLVLLILYSNQDSQGKKLSCRVEMTRGLGSIAVYSVAFTTAWALGSGIF